MRTQVSRLTAAVTNKTKELHLFAVQLEKFEAMHADEVADKEEVLARFTAEKSVSPEALRSALAEVDALKLRLEEAEAKAEAKAEASIMHSEEEAAAVRATCDAALEEKELAWRAAHDAFKATHEARAEALAETKAEMGDDRTRAVTDLQGRLAAVEAAAGRAALEAEGKLAALRASYEEALAEKEAAWRAAHDRAKAAVEVGVESGKEDGGSGGGGGDVGDDRAEVVAGLRGRLAAAEGDAAQAAAAAAEKQADLRASYVEHGTRTRASERSCTSGLCEEVATSGCCSKEAIFAKAPKHRMCRTVLWCSLTNTLNSLSLSHALSLSLPSSAAFNLLPVHAASRRPSRRRRPRGRRARQSLRRRRVAPREAGRTRLAWRARR